MKKLIPKIIDVICFVGGTIIVGESLLFIFHKYNYSIFGSYLHRNYYSYDEVYGTYIRSHTYHYDNIGQIERLAGVYLIVGIVLIVSGFLIRNWRKQKINSN